MPNSTKRLLAESFKKLLMDKPMLKITVQDITKEAEVSRKTFYYYFQDIYDLMEWILWEDSKQLLGNITGDTWPDCILKTLQYLQENRTLIFNAYNSIDRDTLEVYIGRVLEQPIRNLLKEQPESEKLKPEMEKSIVEIYTYGLVGNILHWVGDGMKDLPVQLTQNFEIIYKGSLKNVVHQFVQEQEGNLKQN